MDELIQSLLDFVIAPPGEQVSPGAMAGNVAPMQVSDHESALGGEPQGTA
jgi:hypothetical protein